MLICIPTNGDAGVEDTVCDHFGSAPYFTVYDAESEDVQVIENRNVHHSHGTCHPMSQLADYHVDGVVCGGMGRRATEALNSEGIKIYHADSVRVCEVIEQIKSGKLREMDPATACLGHVHKGMKLQGETHRHGGGGCCGHGPGGGRKGSGGKT
jgi:predicted Fe-Mo cluster-binding NifX family protein